MKEILALLLGISLLLSPVRALAAASDDLTSTSRSHVADNPNFQSAVLQTTAGNRTVNSGDALTPAEHLALSQVLNTGSQSIALSGGGAAVGGSFNLSQLTSVTPQNLTVPAGVTAIMNAVTHTNLNVVGNFTNSGSFYVFTSQAQSIQASIAAQNIFNQSGAVISSVLPGDLAAQLSSQAPVDLTLRAVQSIVNEGTISSAGKLNLESGTGLSNSGILQAFGNMQLHSGSGQFRNSGTISSSTGNLKFTAGPTTTLSLNNINGVLRSAGSIDFRTADYSNDKFTLVLGGVLDAPVINVNGGSGKVAVHASEIAGIINATGARVLLGVELGTMRAGNVSAAGAGTTAINLYSLNGDVELHGDVVADPRGTILIAASRDIVAKPGANKISVESTEGGASIKLIAGGLFESSFSGSNKVGFLSSPDVRSSLSLSGISATGGTIDLSSQNAVGIISTRATAGNASGGAIVFNAFAGSSANSGRILIPDSTTIRSGGHGTGSNGSVVLLAGAASGTSIDVGGIDATGGTGGSDPADSARAMYLSNAAGRVSLRTAQPALTPGTKVAPLFSSIDGTQSIAGSLPLLNFRDASISSGSITSSGADVFVLSGSHANPGAITASSGRTVQVRSNVNETASNLGGSPNSSNAGSSGPPVVVDLPQAALALPAAAVSRVANSFGSSAVPTPPSSLIIPTATPPVSGTTVQATPLPNLASVQVDQPQFVLAGYSKDGVVKQVPRVDRTTETVSEEMVYSNTSAATVSPAIRLAHKNSASKKIKVEDLPDRDDHDLVRVMGAPGFAVYGWFSGNTRMETNNGSVVTQLHNGAKVTKLGNGSTITQFKDGSTMTEVGGVAIRTSPDGTVFTDYKNGTTSTKYKDGTTVVQTADGCMVANYPDGTRVERQTDGTITTTYPSGKKVVTSPASAPKLVPAKQMPNTDKPGTKSEKLAPSPVIPISSDTQKNSKVKSLCLPVGHLMLSAKKETSVKMVEGTAHLSAKSLAVFAESGADGAVFNFYDASKGGVSINVCGRVLKLPPGHELVMTNKIYAPLEQVNPFPEIPCRSVSEYVLAPDVKVFVAEFSIPSAINVIHPFRDLFQSTLPEDRKLVDKILKTAAAMALVRKDQSPFKLRVMPPKTGPAT
jgi:hypothetical protein